MAEYEQRFDSFREIQEQIDHLRSQINDDIYGIDISKNKNNNKEQPQQQ